MGTADRAGHTDHPRPDLENDHSKPGNVTVVTLPDEFKRGRIWSWNTV
jgi:hypothetical protein